eukprot:gene23488-biopygen2837
MNTRALLKQPEVVGVNKIPAQNVRRCSVSSSFESLHLARGAAAGRRMIFQNEQYDFWRAKNRGPRGIPSVCSM